METLLGGSLIISLFLLVLAIAWVIMPFALIGTKPLLRELIKEKKETNRLLREIGKSANKGIGEKVEATP